MCRSSSREVRRAQIREAQRRSRQRKQESVTRLLQENSQLKAELSRVKDSVSNLVDLTWEELLATGSISSALFDRLVNLSRSVDSSVSHNSPASQLSPSQAGSSQASTTSNPIHMPVHMPPYQPGDLLLQSPANQASQVPPLPFTQALPTSHFQGDFGAGPASAPLFEFSAASAFPFELGRNTVPPFQIEPAFEARPASAPAFALEPAAALTFQARSTSAPLLQMGPAPTPHFEHMSEPNPGQEAQMPQLGYAEQFSQRLASFLEPGNYGEGIPSSLPEGGVRLLPPDENFHDFLSQELMFLQIPDEEDHSSQFSPEKPIVD